MEKLGGASQKDDIHPAELSYGHVGEATYDPEKKSWHFQRRPEGSLCLKPVGECVETLSPSRQERESKSRHGAATRSKLIQDVVDTIPELATAVDIIQPLAQVSEVVDAVTPVHDPLTSDLIAFGKATDVETKRHGDRIVRIAAVASGLNGGVLRLVRLNKEYLSWGRNKGVHLSSQSLRGGQVGYCSLGGGPIQQLCFSGTGSRPGAFLAVRTPSEIVMFRPLLHPTPVRSASMGVSENVYPSSRLDANPVVTISAKQCGPVPAVDVSFNPWNHRGFAMVDQRGYWSVWELDQLPARHNERSKWKVSKLIEGRLDSNVDVEDLRVPEFDFWGRVLWIADASTILVASRKKLRIFNVDSKCSLQGVDVSGLGLSSRGTSILDIKPSPVNLADAFVITSSAIIWTQISPDVVTSGGDAKGPAGKRLLAWTHFRDWHDRSLHLTLGNYGQGTLALVHSRMTTLVTGFAFRSSSDALSLRQSMSDPFIVRCVADKEKTWNANRVLCLAMTPWKYNIQEDCTPTEPGFSCREAEASFYKLLLVHDDLRVSECTYVCTRQDLLANMTLPNLLRLKRIRKSAPRISKAGFIVADGEVYEDDEDDAYFRHDSNVGLYDTGVQPTENAQSNIPINNGWLTQKVEDWRSIPNETIRPIEDCLREAREDIAIKYQNDELLNEPLSAIMHERFHVEDVDAASSALRAFANEVDTLDESTEEGPNTPRSRLKRIQLVRIDCSPNAFNSPESMAEREDMGFMNIYKAILYCWIVMLSSDVSGRVRQTIERSLRNVAVERCLASYAIRSVKEPVLPEEPPSSSTLVMGQQFALPVRRKASASDLTRVNKQQSPTSAGALRPVNSSQSSLSTLDWTPSSRSQRSFSSVSASELEGEVSQRIGNLVRVASQPPLTASTQTLLDHWDVGGDPMFYDWKATTKSLARRGHQPLDDAKESKRRRRVERQLRREKANINIAASENTPVKVIASQPQNQFTAINTQPSSQPTEQHFAMSQGEVGTFGSRKANTKSAAKERKRRRKEGF